MSIRFSVFLACVVASCTAFAPLRSAVRPSHLFMAEEEVAPMDLNLEEMFEVFDEADKAAPTPVSVSSFDPKSQVGITAPLGFFDPLGFATGCGEDQFKLYQEAETKHGRVAMLAFVGLVVGEVLKPSYFFDGQITGMSIYQFQQADDILPSFWVSVMTLIAWVEGYTIINNWQPSAETFSDSSGMAKLNKFTVPGDLKFDPLGLTPKDPSKYASIKQKELNNGRLAMIGVVGYIGQELATGQSIF